MILWVGLLIVGSFGLTLLELAYYAHYNLQKNPMTANANAAYYILRCLFYAVMYLAVVFTMKNPNMAKGENVQYGAPPPPAVAGAPTPQQQAMMGYNPNAPSPGFDPNANSSYYPENAPNPNPGPGPAPPTPNNYNNATYPAPYNGTTGNMSQYPQNTASPPPPAPYNNAGYSAPYSGNNVNYTPVNSPPPPQPYYH